ncbi:MAG: DNA methyltransferase [Pseudomonadota bacterium]
MRDQQSADQPQSGKQSLPLGTIQQGNCIQLAENLPAASIDLIFADPPYNLQLGGDLKRPDGSSVDSVQALWDRFDDFASYDAFTCAWLKAMRRLLKADGTLWVMGSYHNIFRIGAMLQDLEYWLLNDIVWVKKNPMPNFRGRRFTNAHETLIWCAKSKQSRYTFNYQAMKALNENLQMRSDWLLPICSGRERLRDDHNIKAHPTQKPEALLHRVMLAASNPGDIVLDPFSGSGTTVSVAKQLGRRWIGFEHDPAYVELARKRVQHVSRLSDEALRSTAEATHNARIPFGNLVESGLIPAGSTLISECEQFKASVAADGTLITKDKDRVRGSIHQIAARCRGKSNCNGWAYWRLEQQSKQRLEKIPIDRFRQQLRKGLAKPQ